MARLNECAIARGAARPPVSSSARWMPLLMSCAGLLVMVAPALGQNQQYIYISSPTPQTISGFVVDTVKVPGSLALVSGSPFPESLDPEQMAIHPSGKFLFIVNSSSGTSKAVSVFRIDPSTGALTENPHSPFSAGGGVTPQVIVSEPTGRYLYVGNFEPANSSTPPTSGLLNSYLIDQATGDLTPTVAAPNECGPVCSTMPVNPVGLVADPTGKRIYAYGGNNSAQLTGAAILEYTIDSATGNVVPTSGGGTGTFPRCLAMDPKGRFLFSGRGQLGGFIDTNPIPSVGGSLQPPVSSLSLGTGNFPDSLAVDNGGNFLYAVINENGNGNLQGYTIDQTTGALALIQGPPFGVAGTTAESLVADPIGPFLYALGAGVEAFQIGSTGGLKPVSGSPFFSNLVGVAIVMTGATPVQPVSGPVAELTPATLDFGDVTVNTPNGPRPVLLTNVGNQGLAIGTNQILISGTNSSEFTQQNKCPPVLGVALSCTINVTFKPTTTGLQQATLFVNDNAPDTPQKTALSGNGVPPEPAVLLMPGSETFPGTAVGDSSLPKNITLTNSGQATLTFSGAGISLMGTNPGDFMQSNNCGASVAAVASCTITVTFKPTATGTRTATLNIPDNALDSPQQLSLSGSGDAPFAVSAGSGGSTTQTVNAGQTAQYNLQIMPSAGFSGAVTLGCSGAPTAAVCTVSTAPLQVGGGVPTPFTVSVTTTARGSAQLPGIGTNREPQNAPRFLPPQLFPLFVLAALLLLIRGTRANLAGSRRLAYSRAALAAAVLGIIFVSGCGGGSAMSPPPPPPPPPPVGTPAGSYTLMLTATSGSTTQILDLSLKVN
jgi:6-phosphogluconolactonase (cycloisomerase 2 family)